jgi:thymidylate synthase ThyX
MNRHRAGWAISEGSLRFIRFGENIPYWEPDSIVGDNVASPEVVVELLKDLQEQRCDSPVWLWAKKLNEAGSLALRKQLSREVFKQAFADQEQSYRLLEALWENELAPDSKFAGKKQVTSMMRRIVGLGVATGGVWSGNVRALRHVFAMRSSEHAEEEMIHVFSRITAMMAETEPLLFGDFYRDDKGFWRPKYVKV